MSLGSIMNIAASGMTTAQSQLRVISDNVSNVNTPGYIRKIADQQSLANQGVGAGVEIARIRLSTDRFLQVASLNASSDIGRHSTEFEMFDRIQTLFGDPGKSGYFTQIDSMFASFMQASENATSSPLRQDAVYKLKTVLDDAGRISKEIEAVRADADSRLGNAVGRANDLLQQIEKLNNEIAKAQVVGADSTGAQTAQNNLVGELSGLMDVRITNRTMGGIEIRTGTGILLAGQGAATISYAKSGSVTAQSNFNDILVTEPSGIQKSLTQNLQSGEIKGLLTIRDVDAPKASERMAELTSRLVDEMNRAHNASASIPAPSAMNGRNTGMSLETALASFSGVTTVAVVNDQGVIQSQAEIDFTGGNITINGVATTPANFLTTLSGQLGGVTATFTSGALSLSASGGNGLAIADDPTNPSSKSGRGFSHFFGLNDLITSQQPTIYDTGLISTSQHGFSPGETISFRFSDDQGSKIRDVEFTLPVNGGTMGELVTALNDPVSGVGRMGTFSLSSTGELVFTGRSKPPAELSVLKDNTSQVPSGVRMTELFGLGSARASRSNQFEVRSDIARDANNMALSKLDITVPSGTAAISKNDGRGGQLLANVLNNETNFSAAGGAGSVTMSLSRYVSEFSGKLGTKATNAKSKASNASLIYTEAMARRTAVEGVNLDEELINMTTFQQSYNSSARLIQAVTEMYDTLLRMVR